MAIKKMHHDLVLIEPAPAAEVTDSGLFIPIEAQERPLIGTVLLAGDGTSANPKCADKGDKVIYGPHAGQAIIHEKKEYMIMQHKEVYGIID